jgi:chromosome segregation ATPase
MSEFAWDGDVVDAAEPRSPDDLAAGPETLVLSADDFSALEERVLRAVNLVKKARQASSEAEERAAKAEAQLREQASQAEHLQKELTALRAERDQVRLRVDRLLTQLDALEL